MSIVVTPFMTAAKDSHIFVHDVDALYDCEFAQERSLIYA